MPDRLFDTADKYRYSCWGMNMRCQQRQKWPENVYERQIQGKGLLICWNSSNGCTYDFSVKRGKDVKKLINKTKHGPTYDCDVNCELCSGL